MMWNEKIVAAISWLSTVMLTCVEQANEWISLIFFAVSLICSIFNTVIPLIQKAKKDGKVDIDEVKDIVDKVQDTIDDALDKKNK